MIKIAILGHEKFIGHCFLTQIQWVIAIMSMDGKLTGVEFQLYKILINIKNLTHIR